MCKIVYLVFLLLAAGWDLKIKEIPLWVYGLGLGAAIPVRIYEYLVWERGFWTGGLIISMAVGAALLLLAVLSREAVGIGDGVFFLVSGLYLDWQETVVLFLSGLLFCSIYCLIIGVVSMVKRKTIWTQTIPFLPFLVPMGIWMAVYYGGY